VNESPSKAVFLSYASQDAEAAKRIADALRAAGVEVWFDAEGGLEHGDEWDAKIRRQIKECVLFLPIISTNTQAREEGYFRIEWELAAQRALGIASGVAFILPVVIDGTRQPDALVPDRFRSVQWTRLPGGNVPPDILQRFLKLWSHRTGALKNAGAEQAAAEVVPDGSGNSEAPRGAGRSRPVWPWLVLGVVALGVAYLIFKPRRSPEEVARIVADAQKLAQAVTPPAAPLPGDWPKDPELRRAMDLLNGTEANSEDFTLAEEIANRALTQRPTDPEAVIVMARTQGAFLQRGFDRSDERIALARRYAERAVQLAPNDAEALAALGSFVARSDQARAIELLNKAIALRPAEPFIYRQRDNALFNNPQVPPADAIASAEKTTALFPGDALAHYELARHYRDVGRIAEMEQELDRTIAITPIANAIVWKSRIALWGRGDPAGMKALLERVPGRVRSLERVVFSRWAYAMATGQWEEGRIALEDLTSNWIEDFDYIGPKALLAAQLLEQQGKPGLARLKYEAALAELRARQARTPGNATLRSLEVWIAHGLGRDEEARTLNRTRLESIRRPYQFAQLSDWWFSAIPGCLLIGDRPTALTLIREAVTPAKAVAWDGAEAQRLWEGTPDTTAAGGRTALRMRFKFDPRMAPFREDPEIVALLTEPKTVPAPASASVDEKSVAVLAFANLSDDKANEYFSDGISEELINALGKVPGLKVPARTSSFYFKGKNVPVPEIAQQLGVAYVIEGSVQRVGDKVKIGARLTKAADGFQVWSDTFTRDAKDVFAVEEEIAGVIAKNLSLKLGASSAVVATPVKPEALEYYLQAKQAWSLRDKVFDGGKSVEDLLNRALAIEPNFARAHAMLAEVWVARASIVNDTLSRFDQRNSPEQGRVEAKARQAIALDPASPEAHTALALVRWVTWDIAGETRELETALALNPSYAIGHWRHGFALMDDGRMDEALAELKLATQLDPFSQDLMEAYGRVLHVAGRYMEAIAIYDRALALADSVVVREHKAYALAQLGRTEDAIALARGLPKDAWRVRTFAAAGLRAEAQALWRKSPDRPAYYLLLFGRTEEALTALDVPAMRSPDLHDWLFEPWFDPIRNDPRFTKFIATLGLTEAHARAQAWRAAHPPEKMGARK
jgi:TolB-like protein/Tfp pilus assembly protein PilF